jgi:hypothetical protein
MRVREDRMAARPGQRQRSHDLRSCGGHGAFAGVLDVRRLAALAMAGEVPLPPAATPSRMTTGVDAESLPRGITQIA